MISLWKWLRGKKTYIVSFTTACVGLYNLFLSDPTMSEILASSELNMILGALGLSALRAGVEKNK